MGDGAPEVSFRLVKPTARREVRSRKSFAHAMESQELKSEMGKYRKTGQFLWMKSYPLLWWRWWRD